MSKLENILREITPLSPEDSFLVFDRIKASFDFPYHYHPEIELVYVEAVNGIRHVGKNISGFTDSDLLLIGSNVPHLNFDYGIQTECRQLVLQMRESFLQDIILPVPEFENIKKNKTKEIHKLEKEYYKLIRDMI